MKKKQKIIIIIALIVMLIGMSVGFAAFSTNISISSSAGVAPSATDFHIKFSSSESSVVTGQITPSTSGATGEKATLNNSGTMPTISGLKANFTAPGQSVTYTFYVHNTGDYSAYLKNIIFENASGKSSNKACTKTDSTATDSLVAAACNSISITAKVGATTYSQTTNSITNHSLAAKNGKETIVVTISYASGGSKADGDFSVAFGDIKLEYKSTDA